VSVLSEQRKLLAASKTPPKVTEDDKRHPLFAAGYATGFRHACEENVQIAEEEEGG